MTKKRILAAILVLIVTVGLPSVTWTQIARATVEKPRYEVLDKKKGYEIRRYPAYVVAQVALEGDSRTAMNRGFRPLADYIFGNNVSQDKIAMTSPVTQEPAATEEKGEKIAMTSPVTMEPGESTQMVSFILPSEYSLADLPKPKNEAVQLKEVPSRVVAVRRFSWTGNDTHMKEQEAKLREKLAADGIEVVGPPTYARYDPPWTLPLFRRNEVMLPIVDAQEQAAPEPAAH
jgi:hypothetical protein